MKRSTAWRLILLGILLALAVIVGTAYWLIKDPPGPASVACEISWRTPCENR